MIKLNTHQYPVPKDIAVSADFALDILKNNDTYLKLEADLLRSFNFGDLKSFSFNSDGFLSLLCHLGLQGKIAISVGETEALYEAGKLYESLGFDVVWIGLKQDGHIDIDSIKNSNLDFIFISSYTVDTYVKNDLESLKKITNGKIISNGSFDISTKSDALYFDPYKLSGFAISGIILANGLFEEQTIGYKDNLAVVVIKELLNKNSSFNSSLKELFKDILLKTFGDDIYLFVDSNETLEYTLHFGLKGIKARELIRTLALDEILITNGEGCSLGLSKPSRVIQKMGYTQDQSRNAISISFSEYMTEAEIIQVVELMFKRYKQIRILND